MKKSTTTTKDKKVEKTRVIAVKETLSIVCVWLLLYFSITLLTHLLGNQEQRYDPIANGRAEAAIGEIAEGVVVEQTIPIENRTTHINIMFATYMRENTGNVHVVIRGADSSMVYVDQTMDASAMRDNSFVQFRIEPHIDPETDAMCVAAITSDAKEGEAVTIWSSHGDCIEDGVLTINGVEQQGDLTITGTAIRRTKYFNFNRIVKIMFVIVAALVFAYVKKRLYSTVTLRTTLQAIKTRVCNRKNWDILVCLLVSFGGALVFEQVMEPQQLNPYRFCFVFSIITIITIVLWKFKTIVNEVHKLFLVVALPVGILAAICGPIATNVSWDDQIHYRNTVSVTHYGCVEYTGAERNMVDIAYSTFFDDAVGREEQMETMDRLHEEGPIVTGDIGPQNIYGSLAYIPSAIGLSLSDALHLPFHAAFRMGRITNLLFYVTVAYWAIKITPVGKRIMAVIALFPTTVFMAASYSYDPWITSLTMLWLALLFDEIVYVDRKLTVEKALLMLGIFVLACAPKQIYCALGLLFLMMPKEKFDSKKTQLWFYGAAALCAGAVALDFMLPFLYNPGTGDARGGSDVNSTSQLGFVLGNPVAYTKILFNHIKGYLSISNSYGYTVYLAYLGGGSLHKLILALLVAVMITDRSESDLLVVDSARRRALVFFTLFATVCLISTALYISFTPVGLSQINGVQPRYLTPLVFPFLLFLGTGKLRIRIKEEWYNAAVFLVTGIVLFETFWTCCIGRYVV